jgi:hypothetical protein
MKNFSEKKLPKNIKKIRTRSEDMDSYIITNTISANNNNNNTITATTLTPSNHKNLFLEQKV